jgi:hypothetical protein
MEMNDKELTKAAALGVGYALFPEWDCAEKGIFLGQGCDGDLQRIWNPLDDDGDALRLAVLMAKYGAFHIDIYHSQTSCRVTPKDTTENDVYGVCWNNKAPEGCTDEFNQNAATRRAIVRAAAEIGKGVVTTNE